MARRYEYLSDDDLVAKLQKYRDAKEGIELGATLKSIAGEGRRKEYTAANPGDLKQTLRELEYEYSCRPQLSQQFGPSGGSLGVVFGEHPHFGGRTYGY